MAKGKLNIEQQTFVVTSLACFDSPSTVAATLKRDYDISITPQSIESYDPTKVAGRQVAQRWKLLFEQTRKDFLEDTSRIGISHRSVRLRALDRMAAEAERRGNMVLAAALMKQAAEDVGGAYTNRRELTGKDGKDLPAPAPVTIFQLPDNGRG